MNISKAIKVSHFILIIVLVVLAGLYAVNIMLNMADSYNAINDPCKTCQDLTSKICEPKINNDIWCEENECIEINFSG